MRKSTGSTLSLSFHLIQSSIYRFAPSFPKIQLMMKRPEWSCQSKAWTLCLLLSIHSLHSDWICKIQYVNPLLFVIAQIPKQVSSSASILCPGHTRTVVGLNRSETTPDGVFFVSACLGMNSLHAMIRRWNTYAPRYENWKLGGLICWTRGFSASLTSLVGSRMVCSNQQECDSCCNRKRRFFGETVECSDGQSNARVPWEAHCKSSMY